MLQLSSPSKHNAMLGKSIPHPQSTKYDEDGEEDWSTPPAKRMKLEEHDHSQKHSPSSTTPSRRWPPHEVPDSEADSDAEPLDEEPRKRQTDLESALPPIQTDKEAIEAYEATRAAEQAELGLGGRLGERKWTRGRSSIYVDAFNLALETVLADEEHLFDEAEHAVFKLWQGLSYEAQYLYVRLFLRKTSSWHRINKLGYHSDIGDLPQAIADLQLTTELPATSSEADEHPGELEVPEGTTLDTTHAFADRSEDCIKDLEEASSLLLLDELKALAKDARVQGKNKKELLRTFRRTSGKQTGLGFSSLKRNDTEGSTASVAAETVDNDDRESTPTRPENRDAHWVDKIMAETGPCIRLSLPTLKLFERVHLVFYRSTEWTEKSLTTIILARIARWNFPEYIVSRSANIFASRSLLLEFEASLRTQFRVDNVLEFNGTPTKDTLQDVLDIFEQVHPRWTVLLAEEQRKEESIYSTGEGAYLRRLSPAWVYTRIVHKGAYVLGKFKHHLREHEVLCELLMQKLFHTSRRGDWYQRKALLEEHYMHLHLPSPAECKDVESKKKHWKRIALRTCEDGLQDQLTHLIFHHDLQKRVKKLEKQLKVPKRQQHDFQHVSLTKPAERTFEGVRIERPPSNPSSRRNSEQNGAAPPKTDRRGAKTIWIDPATHTKKDDDTGEEISVEVECSVEEMCLSSYRALGYKGYHSEGGIVRTLFAYLFYDVLFVYIPNVFQTEFQTCPLDLHTDAFYPSRISEVNARLNDISNGEAASLIQQVWDVHHELQTCVVGLDWTYELGDLLEIANAFPSAALSTIMKVMAQEYGQRGGGVPDLFLWKPKIGDGQGGEVMFSEVKSENDRLSDTQRMWIDVLSGAGVSVELCHAVAKEVRVQ
jgi:fanconi-associated nuclease 1